MTQKQKSVIIKKHLKSKNIKFLKKFEDRYIFYTIKKKNINGSNKIKKVIENSLNKNKASNIVTINLKKKSYIADYMIVASGTSSRHLQSLSENL